MRSAHTAARGLIPASGAQDAEHDGESQPNMASLQVIMRMDAGHVARTSRPCPGRMDTGCGAPPAARLPWADKLGLSGLNLCGSGAAPRGRFAGKTGGTGMSLDELAAL